MNDYSVHFYSTLKKQYFCEQSLTIDIVQKRNVQVFVDPRSTKFRK